MTQATPDAPKLKDCPVCDGKGYLLCDCWPGDCICGYGDETCEECSGHGFIDPDDDYGYYEGFQQMTSPLTPEAVAQMERQLRAFGGASDVGVMDSEMAHEAADMLTTLAAENATLRASEAAAMERVKVLETAGDILAADASRFHSALWSDAKSALTHTEGN